VITSREGWIYQTSPNFARMPAVMRTT
jgi:hypothetical protein